jgi:hypothetical protein
LRRKRSRQASDCSTGTAAPSDISPPQAETTLPAVLTLGWDDAYSLTNWKNTSTIRKYP